MGTCQEHVPATEQQRHLSPASAETSPVLLQLFTINTPREFRVENGALCAPGKLVEQVFR